MRLYTLDNYQEFLDIIFSQLESVGFKLDEFSALDHLCFRTDSRETYEKYKADFAQRFELVKEPIISGRPIAVFRFDKPLQYRGFSIPALEVPAPKPGDNHQNSLQHIEFVIGESFRDFMLRHKDVKFNTESMNRPGNPELIWEILPYEVKFRPNSILSEGKK